MFRRLELNSGLKSCSRDGGHSTEDPVELPAPGDGRRWRLPVFLVCALVLGAARSTVADQLIPRPRIDKPAKTEVNLMFHQADVISVKFHDGLMIRARNGDITDFDTGALRDAQATLTGLDGGTWEPAHSLPADDLDQLRWTAQSNLGRAVADLNLQFNFILPPGTDAGAAIDAFNDLDCVEIALPVPLPMAAPVPPSYQSNQGYLNASTSGVDATCMWQLPGGTAAGFAVADLEYDWNFNHQDLNSPTLLGATQVNPCNCPPPGDPCLCNEDHGTAVLGEMGSLNNGWGTTGIAYGCTLYVVAVNTSAGYNVGSAITTALGTLVAGDVILIEQQIAGPNYTGSPPGTQFGLVAVEWYQPYYNAIVTAVGNGVIVVEAAGNGQQNLDDTVYQTGHAPFMPANDSGAIIVGAGASPGGSENDRSRLWFSNYGSTVDLQGWGENVYTTGYGDLYSTEGKNLWYTSTFGGTSSASPIVAGACLVLESAYFAGAGAVLTPAQVKANLQTTGSAQQAGTYSGNIGPRPDASAALCAALPALDANANLVPDLCEQLTGIQACCFPSGSCTDTTPANCTTYGGTAQGAGTACATTQCTAPTEACCFSNGTCADMTPAACTAAAGTPQGPGTLCVTTQCPSSTEACCFTNGSCSDATPANCAANGGMPQGLGTTCATWVCQPQPEACCLPGGACVMVPAAQCTAQGGFPAPGVPCLGDGDGNGIDDACEGFAGDYVFEFSLDIGSDIELSDPIPDGNEAADPGDVYWWQSAPIVPPGRDGFKDDFTIFNTDPWPDPPDMMLATAVPVGYGSPEDYWEYFDLDAHDQLDIDLLESLIIPPDHPLEMPIEYFDSWCIHGPDYLMISFDDDMAPGWPVNDVPVMVPSPAGVSSYGSTAGQDEILGVNVMVQPTPPPYPLQKIYPIADEMTVHQSLMPNPDNGDEEHDDDVDSLDIVPGLEEPGCPHWYFSADHEAHLGLDPGGIYQAVPGGYGQVIDEIHLGIPEETDIDAFEFAWVEHPDWPGMKYLALLFSVDEDDPLTPIDESGGMDPMMVWVSWMTGFSIPMTDPLGDDIDALTAWREPLIEMEIGACCLPDGTCADGMTLPDCDAAVGMWHGPGSMCAAVDCCITRCPGDVNSDGVVNGLDIQCFVDCVVNGSAMLPCNCACADFNGSVPPGVDDVAPFVQELLNPIGCP